MWARTWIAQTVLIMMVLSGIGTAVLEAAIPVGTAFTYQGRLEDGQVPANGIYDMEFRLYDDATTGSQHGSTVTALAVTVTDGWVTTELDFGEVFGSDALWLEISVRSTGGGSYTILSPRRELTPTPHAIRAEEAGHAINADTAVMAYELEGHSAGDFLDISSSLQIKEGRLVVGAASGTAYDYGLEAYGSFGGGRFKDSDGSGFAVLAYDHTGVMAEGDLRGAYFENGTNASATSIAINGRGIEAEGSEMGGYFADSDGTGVAYVGSGDRGIEAMGPEMGGYFADPDDSGTAYVGYGDRGIEAKGSEMGGYFFDSDGGAIAEVASGAFGIRGWGSNAGAFFSDSNDSGTAYLGYADIGVVGSGEEMGGGFSQPTGSGWANLAYGDRGVHAEGSEMGGYFADSNGTGYAQVGDNNYGIRAFGNSAGGYFEESDGSGRAFLGRDDYGIHGIGSTGGGVFEDLEDSGIAYTAFCDRGIHAEGSETGGYFEDKDDSGYAYAGWSDLGLRGFGDAAGGYFQDLTSSSHGYVGYSTYKIQGSGTVSFVQNHPYDDSKVVVYHAPEASEVAVYTRGSARLEGGRAAITLDPTFALVANPDLGLTAHLTARAPAADLHVASVSAHELVVEGVGDSVFDYMVWGLRIGFEELAPVQFKEREAFIPSMHDHRELYAVEPSLRGFNAHERFASTEREMKGLPKTAALDLGGAEALKAAIHEFDPAVDELPGRGGELDRLEPADSDPAGLVEKRERRESVRFASGDRVAHASRWSAGTAVAQPEDSVPMMGADGNLDARSLRTEGGELAVELPAVAGIAPGDVVAVDPDTGLLTPAATSGDLRVVGIATDDPGVVLGSAAEGDPADARVVLSGLATCRVDAGYGDILPGDLLIASPTPGHAMRAGGDPLPGSVVAKALEPLSDGQGAIRVLVWLR